MQDDMTAYPLFTEELKTGIGYRQVEDLMRMQNLTLFLGLSNQKKQLPMSK
jgi:hypothetical protein